MKLKLDFTNVNDNGDFKKVDKPGTYNVKISKVEAKKSQAGKPYLNWEFTVIDEEFKGSKLWFVTSLQPQALFNLRNLLVAAGLDVPKSVVSIDLDTVIGRIVAVKVEMETYNGEQRARVKSIIKAKDSNSGIMDLTDVPDEAFDEEEEDIGNIDLEGLDL